MKVYTEAIKINFNDAVLFSNRSVCYDKLKFFEEAILDAQEAIRIDPTYIKAYNRLANSYKAVGQIKKAVQAYRKVMSLTVNVEILTYCKEQITKFRRENNLGRNKKIIAETVNKSSNETKNFNVSIFILMKLYK